MLNNNNMTIKQLINEINIIKNRIENKHKFSNINNIFKTHLKTNHKKYNISWINRSIDHSYNILKKLTLCDSKILQPIHKYPFYKVKNNKYTNMQLFCRKRSLDNIPHYKLKGVNKSQDLNIQSTMQDYKNNRSNIHHYQSWNVNKFHSLKCKKCPDTMQQMLSKTATKMKSVFKQKQQCSYIDIGKGWNPRIMNSVKQKFFDNSNNDMQQH